MWKFPQDVSGSLSEREGFALGELAQGGVIVEIGSYCGRSTICMAQEANRVHSVDWHKGDNDVGDTFTLATFIAELQRYGVRDKVCIHVGDSFGILRVMAAGFADLVFVDGGHDFATEAADLLQAKRVVRPGGIIAVHDCHWPEVIRSLAEVKLSSPRVIIDNLAIYDIPS